ncbi:MAG: ParA family protein [Planctomycetales bacterium]|nr:ParA family protein [Planctomycetales bacterium]
MIVSTVNSKGGVGKTTIAVHLADWLRLHGYEVVLVDCDAQRLSSRWLGFACPELNTVVLDTPVAIEARLPVLNDRYDAVIVDAPGGLGDIAGAILGQTDAVFIPTGPSNLDIMALSWATTTVHEVQRLRGGLPQTVIIPVQARAGRRTTNNLIERAQQFGFGITESLLPYREIYAQVSGLDDRPPKLLWQLGRSKRVRQAALEMDALLQEIFPEACEGDPNRIARMVSTKHQPCIEVKGNDTRKVANG